MSKIPLPDRGQPLDVTYIYQMANSINDLSNSISSATYSNTSVFTKDAGKIDVKTSQARVVAGFVDITNNETVSAGTTKPFAFNYPTDFKYPPICTATVMNNGVNEIGDDVSVVIRIITTSRIEGVVKFNKAGPATTSVNIIAVGIAS